MLLLSREPDGILLYASPLAAPTSLDARLERWAEATYPRVVEARLAHDPVVSRHFSPVAWLPLGEAGAGYVLLAARRGE